MSQIEKIRDQVRDISEDDIEVIFQKYPIKTPVHPTTFKELVEGAAEAAMLKAKQADEVEKQKDAHEKEVEALKDRHERQNERQAGLDAKETEDDAIRKQREADRKAAEKANKSESLEEGPLVIPNEVQADKMIADKMLDMLRKANWNKKVKLAKEFGIKLSKRGKAYQIEELISEFHDKMPEKIRVRILQHMNKLMDLPYGSIAFKKEKKEMEALQKKYAIKKEAVTERVKPNSKDWEGRATISRNARKDFWKSLKKVKKEELEQQLKTWQEDRNYKKEYENYHGKKEQIARRSKRNEARRSLKNRKDIEGKDVHHKDNNPMNNDKSNLSIVSQHFNRREPRLREGVDGDAMIDLMQKYLMTKDKREKKTLLKQINRYQKKLGLKVTEELGKGATVDDYIKDFLDSDSPQFVGKSKDKIIKMAVAAFKSDK